MARSASSIGGHRVPPLLLSSSAHALLLLLRLSCSLAAAEPSSSPLPVPCEPEQASALLRLKASLLPSGNDDDGSSSSLCAAALGSWRNDTDCCLWEGVSCGYVPGYTAGAQVFSLDLSNCACGGAPLDDGALFSLRSLTHVVKRACNDNDDDSNGSSSKSELRPDLQQGTEGLVGQEVNHHHHFDLVTAKEMEETTSRKWMRTLLWALLALGLYPVHTPLMALRRQQMAPNPVAIIPAEQQEDE